MSGVFLGPRGNAFIYSFISRSLSSGVWSQCEPVTICLNDLKRARVGTESVLSVPKQLKAWAVMELGQVLHFHTCIVYSFPNMAQSFCFQKRPHSSGLCNVLHCRTSPTRCKSSLKSGMRSFWRISLRFCGKTRDVFVSDNKT